MKCFQISTLLFFILVLNSTHGKSRQKRLIYFPEGATFIQLVLGFGLPFEVSKQSVTIGPFVKSLYLLPMNSTIFTNPSIDIDQERKKRATATRWSLYNTLSQAAAFLGYGGKSCVLRTICETAEVPFSEHADIFTEILHVIFTPSTTSEPIDQNYDNEYHAAEKLGKEEKNCAKIFPECTVNLMDSFTEILTHL